MAMPMSWALFVYISLVSKRNAMRTVAMATTAPKSMKQISNVCLHRRPWLKVDIIVPIPSIALYLHLKASLATFLFVGLLDATINSNAKCNPNDSLIKLYEPLSMSLGRISKHECVFVNRRSLHEWDGIKDGRNASFTPGKPLWAISLFIFAVRFT